MPTTALTFAPVAGLALVALVTAACGSAASTGAGSSAGAKPASATTLEVTRSTLAGTIVVA